MILGFTGARNIRGLRQSPVVDFLADLPEAACYVTGAADGIDAFVGAWMHRQYPQARHRIIIPANRTQVTRWWEGRYDRYGTIELIFMPEGTSYEQRNQEIVDYSDKIVGIPEYPERDTRSLRSGTWQTIRMARRAGKMFVPERILILRQETVTS